MFRTLDRYLLKLFLVNYVLALSTLISLYVVLDLFLNLDEFTEAGKPVLQVAANIASYYIYNIPLYFSQLSGVIVLFAACFTLARMQRQNEVTAVLASGTSLYRLVMPLAFGAIGMNVLLVLDQEVLIPQVAPKLARSRDDIEGQRVSEVWFVRDGESRLISAMAFKQSDRKIKGMIIMELRPNGQLGDVITADKASWDEQRHGWQLERGIRTKAVSDLGDVLTSAHAAKKVPEFFYATDLTPEELKLRQTAQWSQFLSVRQLLELESRGDIQPAQTAQIKHSRFTLPINNMILLLLGLSCFMTRLPGSVLTQGGKALGLCSVSFLIAFAGQQLVGSLSVSPALPAWLPIFIFGPLSVVLLDNVKT